MVNNVYVMKLRVYSSFFKNLNV